MLAVRGWSWWFPIPILLCLLSFSCCDSRHLLEEVKPHPPLSSELDSTSASEWKAPSPPNNKRVSNSFSKPTDYFIPQHLVKSIKTSSSSSSSSSSSESGRGIKIAIFDTGLSKQHPHIKNVMDQTDWTNDYHLYDVIGHGTFISGIVAGNYSTCPGIVPDAELYIFKVFNQDREVFTSWFLDALNYAIYLGVDIINLSIGGPDLNDKPFTDKMNEVAANGIIVISAVGNDGPNWGTLTNPADQISVIGVGGYDSLTKKLATFSSRGITKLEMQGRGFGRVKPDILAPARNILSSNFDAQGCRILSGTSMASPMITGVAALLLGAMKKQNVFCSMCNVAGIKQILISTADRIDQASLFEQGPGLVNAEAALQLITHVDPHVSLFPEYVSNSPDECPYMWPFCSQPIYYTAQPFMVNYTILNSLQSSSKILKIKWKEFFLDESFSVKHEVIQNQHGSIQTHVMRSMLFEISLVYSRELWPYGGFISISLTSLKNHFMQNLDFLEVQIEFTIDIECTDNPCFKCYHHNIATTKLDLILQKTPPREKRILWDVFHSLSYPSAYIPTDDLTQTKEFLDMAGDHPYSNYREVLLDLASRGYYNEILASSWNCFDASNYFIFLIVDPEQQILDSEVIKLERDVRDEALNILLITDWYDELKLLNLRFNDRNTHSTWYPVSGGSNIPDVNKFLRRFDMSLGYRSFDGSIEIAGKQMPFATGNTIAMWPVSGYVWKSKRNELTLHQKSKLRGTVNMNQIVVGFAEILGGGRIVVYGDSSVFDYYKRESPSKKHGVGGADDFLNALIVFLEQGLLPVTTGWPLLEVLESSYVDEKLLGIDLYSPEVVEQMNLDKKFRQLEFSRYAHANESFSCPRAN